jgi:hypothetical protein
VPAWRISSTSLTASSACGIHKDLTLTALDYIETYRLRPTRTNSGAGPLAWEASTRLTEFAETGSPSYASTAAWTRATRIVLLGRPAPRTQHPAPSLDDEPEAGDS